MPRRRPYRGKGSAIVEDIQIANPTEWDQNPRLFVIAFGANADIKFYVWAASVERAIEEAAGALTEVEAEHLKYEPTEGELDQIREELGPEASDADIEERWSVDMYWIDALGSYIPGEEWRVDEIRDDEEIAEVTRRSRQDSHSTPRGGPRRNPGLAGLAALNTGLATVRLLSGARRNPIRGRKPTAGGTRGRPARRIPSPPSSAGAQATGGPRGASRPGAGLPRLRPDRGAGRDRPLARPPTRGATPGGGPRRNPSGKSVKVHLSENNMGHLEINPVNERLKRKYQNMVIKEHKRGSPEMHEPHRRDETVEWLQQGGVVYVQTDYEVDAIYDELGLRPAERRDAREWGITKIVPLDTFEHWFGAYNEIDMGY